MTIYWKAVEQYFTVVLSVFQFYPVCNFGKFINCGLGTVRSERVKRWQHTGVKWLRVRRFTNLPVSVALMYSEKNEEKKKTLHSETNELCVRANESFCWLWQMVQRHLQAHQVVQKIAMNVYKWNDSYHFTADSFRETSSRLTSWGGAWIFSQTMQYEQDTESDPNPLNKRLQRRI